MQTGEVEFNVNVSVSLEFKTRHTRQEKGDQRLQNLALVRHAGNLRISFSNLLFDSWRNRGPDTAPSGSRVSGRSHARGMLTTC